MRVTAVIIAHDETRYGWLKEAISDVLNQTRKVDEIILLTDYPCSVDERIRVIDTSKVEAENCYTYVKFNYSLQYIDTDAVFFLCDDDRLSCFYVERTMKVMEETESDLVYTDWELFGIDSRKSFSREWALKNISFGGSIPITSLISMKVFDKVRYNDLVYGDWDFYWSMFEAGFTASWIKEPLFLYRTHVDQMSRNVDVEKYTEEVELIHAHS